MKPGSSFKLRREVKRLAAKFLNPHERGAFIRSMISAQLEAESVARKPLKIKDKE